MELMSHPVCQSCCFSAPSIWQLEGIWLAGWQGQQASGPTDEERRHVFGEDRGLETDNFQHHEI